VSRFQTVSVLAKDNFFDVSRGGKIVVSPPPVYREHWPVETYTFIPSYEPWMVASYWGVHALGTVGSPLHTACV
jgi:hypothetical protein